MNSNALLLTNGLLTHGDAKTAHGLIRGGERYYILGVIDPPTAGRDAGEVLDGIHRNIPVFVSLEFALASLPAVDFLIIGVATVGGVLPSDMLEIIESAIQSGLSIVNGLHDYLNARPELVALAAQHRVELVDIRQPKARRDLHFWTGEIFDVTAPIVAVLGTDCALGKRTTARLIREACQSDSMNAQMIYTGQTGWLQGGKYGFIFDSTLNDFVSGELEHAIVTCWRETGADLILLEGQASLRNPSGPCGSEFLVSGNAKYVVLVHAPKREFYENEAHWGRIPSVESEIELIENYGARILALALNTEGCTETEAFDFQASYEKKLNMPVLLPLQEGVAKLPPFLREIL